MFFSIFKKGMNSGDDREIWVKYLSKIAEPILSNVSNGTLKQNMYVECKDESKIKFSYLEAVARLTCGIAPWLELGPDDTYEGKLRKKYIDLITKGIVNICNPESDDYLIFEGFQEPLVDAAFLVQGLLRAKTQIWDNISEDNQILIINALKKTRSINPYYNNWLLFSSIIEAFFLDTIGEYDENRLMRGVNIFINEWYYGDAHYKDGEYFHFDYYNSFVIHPMLTDILIILKKHGIVGEELVETQLNRLKHYSNHLERLISPEGTYPIFGRSMAYRTGIFHALAQSCLFGLYEDIFPGQVRAALTKVIENQFSSDDNFNNGGWLILGFNGHQQDIAEDYINTGSLYLCTTIFLPLGLSEDNEFWSSPKEEWTSIKGWNGEKILKSNFINDK